MSFFCLIGNSSGFPIKKKRSAEDAHSRDWKYVAIATALGASISQAICFVLCRRHGRMSNGTVASDDDKSPAVSADTFQNNCGEQRSGICFRPERSFHKANPARANRFWKVVRHLRRALFILIHSLISAYFLSLSCTSWYPPSTMLVELTTVSLASRCRSGIVVTPQLHMVDFTLYRDFCTLSCSGPA